MIIGRKPELKSLEKIFKSQKAEFIAVYGRRRVGKTFLIREFFSKKDCIFFHATGIQKGKKKTQLKKFADAASSAFFGNTEIVPPKEWDDAFSLLTKQIQATKKKIVIFLDELPWLATKKSGLLQELDHYWNNKWSAFQNVILIVCGSSASWLIKKIINDRGGLHNRITGKINLLPFSLAETRDLLKHNKIDLPHEQILDIYMALGGIPYYLGYVSTKETAQQNIQRIFFEKNAPLKDEYDKLFESLFENAKAFKELVFLISQKNIGISKAELATDAELSKSGGRLTERLDDLCAAGFIEKYTPWGLKKIEYFKLIDEFCLFYLRWVSPSLGEILRKDYWLTQSKEPAFHSWAGYAFEAVCMKHVHQIVDALHIPASKIGSWRYIPERFTKEDGIQVDLVVDRWDDALNLCEIKYTQEAFTINKKCAEKISVIIETFKKQTGTKKVIFFSLVSANGLKDNIYSEDLINGVVTLDDLFKS